MSIKLGKKSMKNHFAFMGSVYAYLDSCKGKCGKYAELLMPHLPFDFSLMSFLKIACDEGAVGDAGVGVRGVE